MCSKYHMITLNPRTPKVSIDCLKLWRTFFCASEILHIWLRLLSLWDWKHVKESDSEKLPKVVYFRIKKQTAGNKLFKLNPNNRECEKVVWGGNQQTYGMTCMEAKMSLCQCHNRNLDVTIRSWRHFIRVKTLVEHGFTAFSQKRTFGGYRLLSFVLFTSKPKASHYTVCWGWMLLQKKGSMENSSNSKNLA